MKTKILMLLTCLPLSATQLPQISGPRIYLDPLGIGQETFIPSQLKAMRNAYLQEDSRSPVIKQAPPKQTVFNHDSYQIAFIFRDCLRLHSKDSSWMNYTEVPLPGVFDAEFTTDNKSLRVYYRSQSTKVKREYSLDWLKAFAISKAIDLKQKTESLSPKQLCAVKDYVSTKDLIFGHQVTVSKYLQNDQRSSLLGKWCSKLENWWRI